MKKFLKLLDSGDLKFALVVEAAGISETSVNIFQAQRPKIQPPSCSPLRETELSRELMILFSTLIFNAGRRTKILILNQLKRGLQRFDVLVSGRNSCKRI